MRRVSDGQVSRQILQSYNTSYCAQVIVTRAALAISFLLVCGFLPGLSAESLATEGAGNHASKIAEDPYELVREAANRELEAVENDHSLWRYRKFREDKNGQKVIDVYQTKTGDIDRVVSINGKELTVKEHQSENERIDKLIQHPAKMRERQRRQRADGEQLNTILKILPEALQFEFDSISGSLVKLRFKPNPSFHASGHAAEALRHMEGMLVVDMCDKRIAEMSGQLTSDVKFGAGLLGHLQKGGTFLVKQQQVVPGHWDVSELRIHMRGKALCFKAIAIQQKEIYTNYAPVPSETTLQEAAELLKRDATVNTASVN
jgi:hypothetical protein